jgi:phenylacetate-CoA ligase
MPLIRCKLGDIAILEPQPSSCGRYLLVLQEVVGRPQDFLVTADGHFVHGGYFPHTFRNWPEILRYQVYQPDMKHLEVRLVSKHKFDSVWLEKLRKEIQLRFGEGMQIDLTLVDHFELTPTGKHRFIISHVKPDFVD